MSDVSVNEQAEAGVVSAIAQDEIIRQKVRDELAAVKAEGSKTWRFVNSSFGLWVLSSVLLSGVVFIYSEYSAYRTEQRAEVARVSNLRAEISYRLDTNLIGKIFDAAGQADGPPTFLHVAVLCLPANQFGVAQGQDLFPQNLGGVQPLSTVPASQSREIEESVLAGRFIYPEFRDRSIFSLIWELHRSEVDPKQKDLIQSAMDAISDLRRDAALGTTTKPAVEYLVPVNEMIASWN
jgi:hypothetical protein